MEKFNSALFEICEFEIDKLTILIGYFWIFCFSKFQSRDKIKNYPIYQSSINGAPSFQALLEELKAEIFQRISWKNET